MDHHPLSMTMTMRQTTVTTTAKKYSSTTESNQVARGDDGNGNGNENIEQLLRMHHWTLIVCLFAITTVAKILLFPAYRSTDFDVHNHWKALTRNFHNDTKEWYFDDNHVNTVHTLDYPPAFAWFEYLWSNNYLTTYLLQIQWLDDTCFALKDSLPRSLLEQSMEHSVPCVSFMRTTVLLSELVYWIACYVWACLAANKSGGNSNNSNNRRFSWNTFLLISLNPSILWLDHVHFQYNGFLLGILLLSMACLWQGAATENTNTTSTTVTGQQRQSSLSFHFYHLMGAILYAMLLTLKHLYIALGLWYFFYLLRKYCFVTKTNQRNTATNNNNQTDVRSIVFSISRLLILGFVTVTVLILPFVPFLLVQGEDEDNNKNDHHNNARPEQQLQRILQRLFPFGRGLVHDYWAGNIWALYMALHKILKTLVPIDIPPLVVAAVLLVSLLPGCHCAWQAASCSNGAPVACTNNDDDDDNPPSSRHRSSGQSLLLVGVAYSALASFMTAYHVHEKAIVTTLLPLTLWTMSQPLSLSSSTDRLLLFRTQALALTGLLPLLFPPTELVMKLVTGAAYLFYLHWVLFLQQPQQANTYDQDHHHATRESFYLRRGKFSRLLLTTSQEIQLVVATIVVVVFILEIVPVSCFGRFEFIPLALTSVVVACGLCLSFSELLFVALFGRS